ncbi:MAG: hypothetical protein H0X43_03070 [Nitrosospira sp.]|nr:hypothetical protein [Nitrosospira sp.]
MNFAPPAILLACIASFALAGCASQPRSFLAASIPKVAYHDLERSGNPLRLKLVVEFQRNGKHFPRGDVPLKDYANSILRNTAAIIIIAADQVDEGEIRVVVNNVADSGSVAAETARTALPLWVRGKTITDLYEMSMFITARGRSVSRTGIKHAFHTAIGNMDVPENIEVFPSDQAFGKMLEQMILRTLQDVQQSGELT